MYSIESVVMHGVTPTCSAMLSRVDHGLVTLRLARSSRCVITTQSCINNLTISANMAIYLLDLCKRARVVNYSNDARIVDHRNYSRAYGTSCDLKFYTYLSLAAHPEPLAKICHK